MIFDKLSAIDPDSNVNGQIEYRILDDDENGEPNFEYDENGIAEAPFFSIDLPHQGLITIARPLDYEKQQKHVLRIIASVSCLTLMYLPSKCTDLFLKHI